MALSVSMATFDELCAQTESLLIDDHSIGEAVQVLKGIEVKLKCELARLEDRTDSESAKERGVHDEELAVAQALVTGDLNGTHENWEAFVDFDSNRDLATLTFAFSCAGRLSRRCRDDPVVRSRRGRVELRADDCRVVVSARLVPALDSLHVALEGPRADELLRHVLELVAVLADDARRGGFAEINRRDLTMALQRNGESLMELFRGAEGAPGLIDQVAARGGVGGRADAALDAAQSHHQVVQALERRPGVLHR